MPKPSVFSTSDRTTLSKARNKAKADGKNVKVPAHERHQPAALSPIGQRLALWEQLEQRLIQLSKHIDRHGSIVGERRRAFAVIAMLEDTLGISSKA